MSADQTTRFRLAKIEAEQELQRQRTHDALNLVQEAKMRLDAADLETRLRIFEAWMNEQKGREMQNRIIMGVIAAAVSIVGTGLVEYAARHV